MGVWEGIQNPSLFPGLRATTKLAITASASTNSRETEATRRVLPALLAHDFNPKKDTKASRALRV